MFLALALALSLTEPAPPTPMTTPVTTPVTTPMTLATSSPLMEQLRGKIVASASTTWAGWPADRLIDGDARTSWFSARGDAAALGKKPWVALAFPEDITVKKVSLLGNREPNWPKGFTIEYGLVELLDKNGKVVASKKNEGKNLAADVDFAFKEPVPGVRVVRFTSLADQGTQTQYNDIALAEVVVE